jgi:hypothetical protein
MDPLLFSAIKAFCFAASCRAGPEVPKLESRSASLEPDRMKGGHMSAAQITYQEMRTVARVRTWADLPSLKARALSQAAHFLLWNDENEL